MRRCQVKRAVVAQRNVGGPDAVITPELTGEIGARTLRTVLDGAIWQDGGGAAEDYEHAPGWRFEFGSRSITATLADAVSLADADAFLNTPNAIEGNVARTRVRAELQAGQRHMAVEFDPRGSLQIPPGWSVTLKAVAYSAQPGVAEPVLLTNGRVLEGSEDSVVTIEEIDVATYRVDADAYAMQRLRCKDTFRIPPAAEGQTDRFWRFPPGAARYRVTATPNGATQFDPLVVGEVTVISVSIPQVVNDYQVGDDGWRSCAGLIGLLLTNGGSLGAGDADWIVNAEVETWV